MNSFMQSAIEEARAGLAAADGGPFGAVVVRDGKIIARAHNEVVRTNDPTAHAEVGAIRRAAALLGRFDLSDCELYTSCEPCPMCLSAIYWAHIPRIYYAGTRDDAAAIGFDDRFLYEVLGGRAEQERLVSEQLDRDEALPLFREWAASEDKTPY